MISEYRNQSFKQLPAYTHWPALYEVRWQNWFCFQLCLFYTAYHVSYSGYSILTGGSILDNLMGKLGASISILNLLILIGKIGKKR